MYSRRTSIEEKKNTKRAIIFSALTLFSIILIIFFGIPIVAKFATFIANFRDQSARVLVIDDTPPPPPRFDIVPLTTKDTDLELRGNTEAGAKVTINFNSESVDVLSDNQGNFIHEFKLQEGENSFWATSRDTDGNTSVKTGTYKIIVDKKSPDLEIIKPADKSEFSGSRQRQMVLQGKTEPNAKVQVNDRLAIVSADGSFSFTVTLNEGGNTLVISVEDTAGNKTETNLTVNFTL